MMNEGGTVKQFREAIEEMRTLYPFEDDKTRLSTADFRTLAPTCLTLATTDEKTGVFITMSKNIPREV